MSMKLLTKHTGCYTILNLYAILVSSIIYLVFEHTLPFLVFFVLAAPLVILVEHLMNKDRYTSFESMYCLISKVFIMSTWVIFIFLSFQMKATLAAQKAVEDFLGFPPPSSVSDMHSKVDHGWQDSAYWLKFTCTDKDIVERIIQKNEFTESDFYEDGGGRSSPDWWDLMDKKFIHAYSNTEYKHNQYLWYDFENHVVYYFSFNI